MAAASMHTLSACGISLAFEDPCVDLDEVRDTRPDNGKYALKVCKVGITVNLSLTSMCIVDVLKSSRAGRGLELSHRPLRTGES